MTAVQWSLSAAKICYQCDDKNPSSKLKLIGEKITKCEGVPFEKYATKTSRAFGAAVLTCYTVGFDYSFFVRAHAIFFEEIQRIRPCYQTRCIWTWRNLR